jgi:hypothetical protein
MYYSLQSGEIPVYETDTDGNIRYIPVDGNLVPVTTGRTEIGYSEPQEFFSNMAMSGGDAEAKEYGLTTADYDCTLLCVRNAYPIAEGSIIWVDSEIVFKYENKTIPDKTSADYECIKVSKSQNLVKYVLKKLNK